MNGRPALLQLSRVVGLSAALSIFQRDRYLFTLIRVRAGTRVPTSAWFLLPCCVSIGTYARLYVLAQSLLASASEVYVC
jgi:hypothetical protein